tara:strand:+ start:228 stop:482 length:255 start_codon:yes stop_codon:yes gene_type:complete
MGRKRHTVEVKGTHHLYTDIKNTCWGQVLVLMLNSSVVNIPINGWVAAGWVTTFSGNQCAERSGGVADDLGKNFQLQNKSFLLK